MNVKHSITVIIILLCTACAKSDKTFLLKQLKLNHYTPSASKPQGLYLKIFAANTETPLQTTAVYPSEQTLPAAYAIHPKLPLPLYQQNYRVELWGDVDGYLGDCEVDMDNYKIIFPIEIEAESETISVSLSGSWE